jgi:parvulin-like peptidyl-prolyl isomerase
MAQMDPCTGNEPGLADATPSQAVGPNPQEPRQQAHTHILSHLTPLTPRAPRRKSPLATLLAAVSVLVICMVVRYNWGPGAASADTPRSYPLATSKANAPAGTANAGAAAAGTSASSGAAARKAEPDAPSGPARMKVVAVVNGEQITRDQLGQECLRHYGDVDLHLLVNRYLILEECKRQNITITSAEIDGEIERMAKRFKFSVDQWLKLLKQERGITPAQYANDIIWRMLALRKLAGPRLTVTPEELRQAFESQYGAAVRARLIACKDPKLAEKVRASAASKPEDFGELAKQYSEDASASVKGLIEPIHKHGTFHEIEQVAFTMRDGEVSRVIPVANQYVILKKEGTLPEVKAVNFTTVAPQLEEAVREHKLSRVSEEVLLQLQNSAKIERVFDDPLKSRQMPGVAAVINGRQIPLRELAEESIGRHGEVVLEGTINRTLLEQACKKRNITISEKEIEQEIVRAAAEMVPPKPDGSPDVESWLKTVTQQQNVSEEVYRRDSVWPSIALKKLVNQDIKVTEEDLKKGFEANYGPRVRCRAIVMNNARRAQEVWEKARRAQQDWEKTQKKPAVEVFAQLAEQYSIEPSSQALGGEVPPIRKYGGQPELEKEAFSLNAGDLSGIVQVGDKFIILLCEDFTKPVKVNFVEVRGEIEKDLREKKLRLAMGEHFQQLQDMADIDNFLAGTSQTPKGKKANFVPPPSSVPTLRQVPGSR